MELQPRRTCVPSGLGGLAFAVELTADLIPKFTVTTILDPAQSWRFIEFPVTMNAGAFPIIAVGVSEEIPRSQPPRDHDAYQGPPKLRSS